MMPSNYYRKSTVVRSALGNSNMQQIIGAVVWRGLLANLAMDTATHAYWCWHRVRWWYIVANRT